MLGGQLQNLEKLGVMGYPLLLTLIILLAIALERCFFFLFLAPFSKKKLSNKLVDILKNCNAANKTTRDAFVSFHFNQAQEKFFAHLKLLRLIASISPIMGLLGTVIGIIKAFRKISVHTQAISPNLIAQELWEALFTTAFGLGICLLATIVIFLINHFAQNIMKKISCRLNEISFNMELLQK